MRKSTLTASAVAAALLATPAFAQSGNTNPPSSAPSSPSTVQQPATGAAPATGAGVTNMQSTQGNARFFTAMEQDQWRASKFEGVDVYGANNEKIGDVDDVILDRNGKVEAVVIGVGGFLGIGEKLVALPFEQVEWMTGDRSDASVSSARPATGSSTMATNNTTAGAPANPNATANTAANPAPNTAANTANRSNTEITGSTVRAGASRYDYPSYGVLRMTKQDLQNAPSYRYGEQMNSAGSKQ
ncbi:PRC-barrel domain-containing protein [Alsobacter sp. R-9]